MRTIDQIITKVSGKYGAPMGRPDVGGDSQGEKVFNCRVRLDSGGYDKGGAYWGHGAELRVRYTRDLTFIQFYRKAN